MKNFAIFYSLSTGYIEGTIPPVFSKEAVKPIPACGSDSTCGIDGRLNLTNAKTLARKVCAARKFVGFTINKGNYLNFREIVPLTLIDQTLNK